MEGWKYERMRASQQPATTIEISEGDGIGDDGAGVLGR